MLRILPAAALLALLVASSPLPATASTHHASHASSTHQLKTSSATHRTPHASGSRESARTRVRTTALSRASLRTDSPSLRTASLSARRKQEGAIRSTRRAVARTTGHRRRNAPHEALNVAGNPGPRGATPEDFLSAARSQPHAAPASQGRSGGRAQHASSADATAHPTSVVSIVRPSTDHPQLPPVATAVEEPLLLPTLFNARGRLLMPAPLRGSHEILVHQNQVADDDGLGRVQDDADLEGMRRRGMLVPVPVSAALVVDERLPEDRRVCRPWTADFLATLARAHYARFRTPLQLNSAVRTVAFQQHLLHVNGNAAPAEGDTASPHLTGQAVDLAKRGLSLTEIAWMRGYLLPLIDAGKIDVEEEFKQSCFHISVYRRYQPGTTPPEHYNVASRAITPALATSLQ